MRLALHHLREEGRMGMGDARGEIEPSIVGDLRLGRGNNMNVEERGSTSISFRCGGFEIHGGELAESAGDVELLELGNSGERRKTERERERPN